MGNIFTSYATVSFSVSTIALLIGLAMSLANSGTVFLLVASLQQTLVYKWDNPSQQLHHQIKFYFLIMELDCSCRLHTFKT
jgi:hypothetical protein